MAVSMSGLGDGAVTMGPISSGSGTEDRVTRSHIQGTKTYNYDIKYNTWKRINHSDSECCIPSMMSLFRDILNLIS